MQLYAHLDSDSARAQEWLDTFGTLSIPILSPVPEIRSMPPRTNDDSLGLFYLVDVARLSGEQKDRIVAHVAKRWHIHPDKIRDDFFGEHGIPILADTDILVSDRPVRVL